MTKEARKSSKLPAKKGAGKKAKHCLWVDFRKAKIDGRTQLGKAMSKLRDELVEHCGGSPTVSQRILIERVIGKNVKCFLYEHGTLNDPASMGSRDFYLACANSLRLDLQVLGMQRRGKKVQSLEDYLRSKEKAGVCE